MMEPKSEWLGCANQAGYPAFPTKDQTGGRWSGLTVRELFAAMAMAGLLANPSERWQVAIVANIAVNHADALIAALNEGEG
jgi:hypothetical protein